jgi:hypothetical protein
LQSRTSLAPLITLITLIALITLLKLITLMLQVLQGGEELGHGRASLIDDHKSALLRGSRVGDRSPSV